MQPDLRDTASDFKGILPSVCARAVECVTRDDVRATSSRYWLPRSGGSAAAFNGYFKYVALMSTRAWRVDDWEIPKFDGCGRRTICVWHRRSDFNHICRPAARSPA